MAGPSYLMSPFGFAKRLKIVPQAISSIRQASSSYQSRQPWHAEPSHILDIHKEGDVGLEQDLVEHAEEARGAVLPRRNASIPPMIAEEINSIRLPRSVQLTHLRPLKRSPTYGYPSADLQLRSYSVRNLEFMADFALRAAYYLNLPARGPVPLPRIVERWTVPRSNFVHKKSQENFERRTVRRLIQIQDGHPETVGVWLSFIQRHMYYGVGYKANVWEYSGVDVAKEMDAGAEEVKDKIGERLQLFGKRADLVGEKETIRREIHDQYFKGMGGASGPLGSMPA